MMIPLAPIERSIGEGGWQWLVYFYVVLGSNTLMQNVVLLIYTPMSEHVYVDYLMPFVYMTVGTSVPFILMLSGDFPTPFVVPMVAAVLWISTAVVINWRFLRRTPRLKAMDENAVTTPVKPKGKRSKPGVVVQVDAENSIGEASESSSSSLYDDAYSPDVPTVSILTPPLRTAVPPAANAAKTPGLLTPMAAEAGCSHSPQASPRTATLGMSLRFDTQVASKLRKLIVLTSVIVAIGTYYILCMAFLVLFATVARDSAPVQLTIGILFTVTNFSARSFVLKAIFIRAGADAVPELRPIISFFFELLGEAFLALSFPAAKELYVSAVLVALEVLLFSASANGSFILTRKFVRQGDKYVATALAQELDMAEDDAEAETTPNTPFGALHGSGEKSPVAGRKSPASHRRPSITPQATVTSSFVALVNDPKERIAREWMQIKAQDSFIHFLGELSATVGFAALYLWYVYGWNSDYFPFPNTHKNAADVYTPLIFVSISFVLHIVFFTLHVVFVLHRYSCNVIRCGLALLENKRLFWALVLQTFIALKLMDTFLASHNHVYSYLQSL